MKKLNLKKIVDNLVDLPALIDVNIKIEDENELRDYKNNLHDELLELLADNNIGDFIDGTYDEKVVLNACETLLNKKAKIFFALGLLETDILSGGNTYYVDDDSIELDSTALKFDEYGGYGLFVWKSEDDNLIYENGYYQEFSTFGCEYYELNFQHDEYAKLIYKAIDEKDIWD